MDEEIRVTSTKKPKKIVKILLIVTGILGLALIAVALYFYKIGDNTKEQEQTTVTCGCYYIDPAVVSECGDPRRAFKFETATATTGQTCKAACATSKISTNILNSTTKQDLFQICQLQSIQDNRCTEMTITDSTGKVITGKVNGDQKVTVEAKFNNAYTTPQFIINNQNTDPDTVSPDKLTIKKTISSLDNISTLNIVATAKTTSGEQINSPICRRLIDVDQDGVSNVNNVQVQTRSDNKVLKISKVSISTGNLTSSDNLKLLFTFDKNIPSLTMTKGFTTDLTKGVIEIVEQDLYNSANFSPTGSFTQLNEQEGEVVLTVKVSNATTDIGTASTTVTFPTQEEPTENPTQEESKFSITKTSSVECVERVSPNNVAQFTITAKNEGTTSQEITSITDKLPLGFTYVTGSSKVNGTAVTDADTLTISTVGNTQEIVWKKTDPWTLTAGQALTIVLNVQAGTNALTGKNQNEAIVTPVEIPADPATLRTEAVITVAQDCNNITDEEEQEPTTPSTGIFDSIVTKVLLGVVTIFLGWVLYNRPEGKIVTEKILQSGMYKGAELTSFKLFKPKRYFEEKVLRKVTKKS